MQQHLHILRRIRKQYMRAKCRQHARQCLAALAVGLTMLYRWKFDVPLLAAAALALLLGAVCYFVWAWRQTQKTSLKQVARHLNRRYPQLEDSAELLLREPQHLLESLQQQKVAERLQQLQPAQDEVFRLRTRPSWIALGFGFVLSAGLLYAPALPEMDAAPAPQLTIDFPDQAKGMADTAVAIEAIDITVTPPAYTGKAPYRAASPNLRIAEGATVSWQIRTNHPARQLQLVLQEAAPLALQQQGQSYHLSRRFSQPTLYHFRLNGRESTYYTLEIIPDEAPAIELRQPEQYTEILFGAPQRVSLQALLTDDYGLRQANLVATVAKGEGEAVRFREEKISLGHSGGKRSFRVDKMLDLQKLGITYGDELYFYVQAWDQRGGYTRSDTYLVQIEDTAVMEAAFDMSMGVNPVPEYFRSQRQIIIDTEKLLQEQPRISRAAFTERSNNLGVDQKLLRLRYGKFLGEEFESGIGPGGGIPEGEAGHPDTDHFPGDGHDHPEFADKNSAEALLSPYMHKHDQEGEATFFEPAVKAKLKGALAQMWEAELRLRTLRPREALPFAYKALRMLKEVQQSTRAYVGKTGFEPPPLKEVEKRLTGELGKVAPPAAQQNIKATTRLPHTRAALRWLERYRQQGRYRQTDALLLEQAGRELAQEALGKPGRYLRALQDLRSLVSEMQQGQALCVACLLRLEQAWHELLPAAQRTPQPQRTARSALSGLYFKQLNRK